MFETPFFGRVLLLDDEIMITERDEAHYHEMLAHVPLAYLPDARRVLIIGGGDGGTLTQVLKHPVRRAIELDRVDASYELHPRTTSCMCLYAAYVCLTRRCCMLPLPQNIQHVTMVEIDSMVVRLSKQYFPNVAKGYEFVHLVAILWPICGVALTTTC